MDFIKTRYGAMSRRRKIYEGKAKILYEGPEPATLVQHFKDDATAFNAKKHDILDGKGGADILRGYGGSDTFVFSTTLGASNIDHIVDFSTTADTIRLDQTIFSTLGIGALNIDAFKDIGVAGAVVDSTDRILYDHNTGALYYDADGSGTAARIQFAVLDNKPTTLTHAGFFVVA